MTTEYDWFKSLKAGDEVLVECFPGPFRYMSRVEKITETGRVVVDGTQYTDTRNKGTYISELTPAIREEIILERKRRSIKQFDWANASEKLIADVFDSLRKQGGEA